MTTLFRGWRIPFLGALLTPCLAPLALGQQRGTHERADMPYMPPAQPRRLSPPPRFGGDDGFQSQVNTTAAGMNIIGDAANEPSIAVDPTAPNRIAIGWRQFDTIASSFRQAGYAYSRDGGRTWHNGGVLRPGVFGSDPVVRADSHGSFYYLSLDQNFHTWLFRSLDGGATYGNPSASFGGDKEWLTIDTSGTSTDGVLYENYQGQFTRSFDHGATWSTPISGVLSRGNGVVGPDGTLYLGGGEFPVGVSISSNAGSMGSTPTFCTAGADLGGSAVFEGPPNPAGLLGQTSVDVDRSSGPRHGWIYVVCTVSRSATNTVDVMFNRSPDGGHTWLQNPVRINDDSVVPNTYHWFATMSTSPGGRIDVVWNDTRESQSARLSRLYYSYSTDGGDTWARNVPLGPQWDSWIGWPGGNQKIGDYYDMVSDRVGAFLAYAATYNGEQDVYFLRINDWDCNGNGIADSMDLANGVLHDCNGNGVPDECEIAAGNLVPCACYPNCDLSTLPPVLNVNDFICFQQRFARGDAYANCDGSTTPPILSANDFICFLRAFAAGCS